MYSGTYAFFHGRGVNIKITKKCRQFAPGSRLIECTHNGKRFDQQKGNVRCSVKRKLRPCPY
nr:MAG TPA: hypothetical protein [Caudoviricetes sp.]